MLRLIWCLCVLVILFGFAYGASVFIVDVLDLSEAAEIVASTTLGVIAALVIAIPLIDEW